MFLNTVCTHVCDVLDFKKENQNKATKKSPEQLEVNSSRAGTLGVAEETPIAEVSTGPVWRTARCLLLCRQEGAEELCLVPLQKGKTPAPLQDSGRKHTEHKLFYTASPKYLSLVLSFLLYSVCVYGTGEALRTPTPSWEHRGRSCRRSRDYSPPGNTAAITEQFPPRPCPPPSPILGGAVGEQPPHSWENPQPALQRPGLPGFPFKHQPSTCKGRGLKCSLSGRVWQQSKAKVTLLPNLNSTVGLELLKLADISLFQGKKNFFFPFPKKLVVSVPHQPHATHTQGEALALKLAHCEEKGLSRFTANAWDVLDFKSTHHNNRKSHYGWNYFL